MQCRKTCCLLIKHCKIVKFNITLNHSCVNWFFLTFKGSICCCPEITDNTIFIMLQITAFVFYHLFNCVLFKNYFNIAFKRKWYYSQSFLFYRDLKRKRYSFAMKHLCTSLLMQRKKEKLVHDVVCRVH